MAIKWTQEEVDLLIVKYPHKITKDLLEIFPNRNKQALHAKASTLQLKKTPELLQSITSNPSEATIASRFKKGQTAINKGKKMPTELKERIKHTFFQKGNKPHNTQPDGTINERPDKSGVIYKYIKIKDSHWELYHRVIWEENNGPIPKGHRIHFINGDTMNCNIENLRCLSAQEAMELNRITKYPNELREVIKLNNKLIKKIKDHGTQ